MDIGRQRKHELEMQGCWIYSEDQRFQSEEGISKEPDGFSFVAEPTTGNVVKPMEMSFNANAMHWGRFGFTQLLALANQSSLGLNYVPGPEVEFPAAQQHCYDLDVFPGTTNNGTYEGVPDFAPVTPEKPARTEDKQQLSEMQHLHEEDRRDEKNDKQKNGGVLTTVNIIEINNDKELPMAASDSLLSDAAVSAPPPKEKHLSGKEDDGYQIDLNKTPQQKTKRKKHRPKVVKEGKPKTPKPVTPKPATGSTGKRKYVRKNGLNKASKTPPAEVVGQCSESKTLKATRKSCKRVLSFAEEQPEDKHSTNRSPSLDSDSYSHIFCSSGVVSKSTVQLCNAIQVTVGNTQAGTASELGCSSHQMRPSYMPNPIIFDSPQTDIRSPNTSNCSTTINLGKGEEAKRKYCHAVKQAESSSSNLIGSYHNSIQAYQAYHMSYLDLPNIGHFPKRKRTEKTDPCDKNKVSVAGWKEIQNCPCVVALGQDARSTRKRSRVHTRVRVKKGDEQRAEYCCKPQTCIDALVTDIGATLIKRKRTKKINSIQPTGSPLEVVAIDAIIDQLKSLDINKEQNALVLYTKVDTVVPYEASKRRLRAKVALDEETTRVWKLLLDNINSEGVDGLDEEKIKWWEEERTVFQGRADSFIARMHLVQGDRGFSRWKGSVVDSVVGVFLTQNVSDHLSSSAFMALAAHFPLESRNNDKAVVCINEIPNSPVKSWSSMTLCSGSNGPVSSTNEIDCEMVCSSETGQGIHYNQLVNVLDISGTVTECRTERDGKTSDEDSSQNYVDSSISQTGDKGCSCSDTNSEVEDLPNKSKHDSLDSSTLFVELLQKAESNELHEVFVHGEYKYNRTKGPEHDKQKQTMDNDGPRTSKGVSSMDNAGASPVECFEIFREETQSSTFSQNKDENSMSGQSTLTVENAATSKSKRKRVQKDKNQEVNWDKLREQAEINGKREKTPSTMDSLDWDAVRCADVNEIAETIKERGMNHMLAERIKDFLNRLVREHGSIDLEWLRDVPPDKAKEYLLSIRGLGLKSVECVRLLTLHHLAFPVDTNVGRIAVRLGWVPLQPLPESLQLHLLELYPVLESIQKYLWPRLCKLDQRTLYELHYQMITFGKVFCTKNKPNCNACPMRGDCRHFASAFASARLSLPWPEEKRVVTATGTVRDVNPTLVNNGTQFALLQATNHLEQNHVLDVNHQPVAITTSRNCEPIIEEPASPEPECTQIPEDIEDAFSEDPDGIPTIKLNVEQFTQNLHTHMQESLHLQEGDMSKALVAIATGATSIPVPMLKNVRRLRTEHLVYELPDSHALLNVLNMEKREPDDPCLYLLAIWTPGETADSIQLPQNRCNSEECVALCNNNECLSCNTVREESSQTVRGTLLIPCRTAMRGSFPLNGTYFQVNEVFADHETSHKPVDVPRSWLWKLKRRTVYFGTSVPSIFKGLSTHEIQQCFWRGHVCVRGFDKRTKAPRPLATRLHCPASKVDKKNVNER